MGDQHFAEFMQRKWEIVGGGAKIITYAGVTNY